MTLTGDWAEVGRILRVNQARLPLVIDRVVKAESERLAKMIRLGITRQSPGGKKLRRPAASTILGRRLAGVRGSLALVSSRKMLRSISARRTGLAAFFVGVPRKRAGSIDMARIAQINEEGMGPVIVRISPKMRRFLHVLFSRTGDAAPRGGERPGFIVIRIPARPFIGPVVDHEMAPRRALPRMERRFSKMTGGDFGRV